MYKVLLAVFFLSCVLQVSADDVNASVIVGGDDDLDACFGFGVVFGLNSKKEGFLAVRSGANVTYEMIDKLQEGQEVFICDTSADGDWFGIVYSYGNTTNDCGVSSPINPAQPYKGKCKSGWVNARWIKLIAG